jgi:hypothetical protein
MPTLLQDFVSTLVSNATKSTAIGHCIVQCVRPNTVISPLLFSVAVSLAHSFGSKWLLTMLSKLGFCLSYDEVVRYKQSVVQCGHDDLPQSFPQKLLSDETSLALNVNTNKRFSYCNVFEFGEMGIRRFGIRLMGLNKIKLGELGLGEMGLTLTLPIPSRWKHTPQQPSFRTACTTVIKIQQFVVQDLA